MCQTRTRYVARNRSAPSAAVKGRKRRGEEKESAFTSLTGREDLDPRTHVRRYVRLPHTAVPTLRISSRGYTYLARWTPRGRLSASVRCLSFQRGLKFRHAAVLPALTHLSEVDQCSKKMRARRGLSAAAEIIYLASRSSPLALSRGALLRRGSARAASRRPRGEIGARS
jgi:hypothetical protein